MDEQLLQPMTAIPLKGIRKSIATRLGHIWREAVHVTLHRAVDVSCLYERKSYLAVPLIDYVLYALVQALKEDRFSVMNSHFDGQRILPYRTINLGYAIDHPKGLIVVNVFHTEAMDIYSFAEARKLQVSKAKAWKHTPSDLENGTFTVTNLGSLGIDYFTPILNPPQSAILGLGRTKIESTTDTWGNAPTIKALLPVSLTVDHRVLDGADAARFIQRVEEHIKELGNNLSE